MKPGAETAAGCGPNSENNSEYQPAAPLFFWPRCRPHPGTLRNRMQLIADNFVAKQQKQPVSPHAANPHPARPGSTRHLAIGALPSASMMQSSMMQSSMMQSSRVWKRLVHNKCDDRKTSIRHWIKA